MTAAVETVGSAGVTGQAADRLRALLDPAFVAEAGWDADRQVLIPPPQHPTLGYPVCPVTGCGVPAVRMNGFCTTCERSWQASGLELVAFLATADATTRIKRRTLGEVDCDVPGCQRPRKTVRVRLCSTHDVQRRERGGGMSIEAFLAHPNTRPLPGLGGCRVPSCIRRAIGRLGLCHAHRLRWIRSGRRPADDLTTDLDAWCQRQQPISESHTVVLRGLPTPMQLELLYGLQQRCRREIKTKIQILRGLANLLRDAAVASITELPADSRAPEGYLELAGSIQTALACALSSPEAEQRKDVWAMGVFGLGGTIDFTWLSQPWLRAGIKHWVAEELPTRRGKGIVAVMRDHLNAVRELSDSLRVHRPDQGTIPALLGRSDIVALLNRLQHLEATGRLSARQRLQRARKIAKVLRDVRALGLTLPGGAMAGLPEDFMLRPGDFPDEPDVDDAGRALPEEILRQLVTALPQLEAAGGRAVRVAVRLLIDTGRRPNEVCSLPWDCLERDADGKHVLVYTNHKANRVGRRLPISDATAELIRDQQQAVRDRFPATPVGELALLPRPKANPNGTHPIRDWLVSRDHRRWIAALGPLRLADGAEFNTAAVVPYAYRHSYAQRHADAGTPVDVLCQLMDHVSMTTTQHYYRVTEKRTRAAVDKLTVYQFNGHGQRVWRQAERLLDHEHQRLRVGQVAVPYGTCTEPSNVKAGGGACPFRFRCHGCAHFRTDPSYLPELRAYLDRLLADRERVHAAVELDDWARAEAMPSDAEIGRVRALIRKIEQAVDDLDEAEQHLVVEATRTLRATRRTVHLGMPTVGPPSTDVRLEATS
jgi:integrase